MKERPVEAALVKGVKEKGGMCIKIMPIIAGLPDRLAVLPGGRFFFVETKSPTGRLRPVQVAIIARLEALGAPVAVLHTPGEVRAWLADLEVD
jgi:hypothetical protein